MFSSGLLRAQERCEAFGSALQDSRHGVPHLRKGDGGKSWSPPAGPLPKSQRVGGAEPSDPRVTFRAIKGSRVSSRAPLPQKQPEDEGAASRAERNSCQAAGEEPGALSQVRGAHMLSVSAQLRLYETCPKLCHLFSTAQRNTLICLHQPWLRFRHREGAAIQMADPKPVPRRGRRGIAGPVCPSGCPARTGLVLGTLWRSAPAVQVHQHLYARYQHCFGATREDRPSGALGQHIPAVPQGWACCFHDAKQILTTCTNTSIPASEAAPTPIQGLQTSTESRRHQIPPDTPSHSPYKVHDP